MTIINSILCFVESLKKKKNHKARLLILLAAGNWFIVFIKKKKPSTNANNIYIYIYNLFGRFDASGLNQLIA